MPGKSRAVVKARHALGGADDGIAVRGVFIKSRPARIQLRVAQTGRENLGCRIEGIQPFEAVIAVETWFLWVRNAQQHAVVVVVHVHGGGQIQRKRHRGMCLRHLRGQSDHAANRDHGKGMPSHLPDFGGPRTRRADDLLGADHSALGSHGFNGSTGGANI